jgi:hypothetical protein
MSKSQQPSSQPATWTEEWRRECEAREWMMRWKEQQSAKGTQWANLWWSRVILKISEIRDPGAAHTLRQDMKRLAYETSRQD